MSLTERELFTLVKLNGRTILSKGPVSYYAYRGLVFGLYTTPEGRPTVTLTGYEDCGICEGTGFLNARISQVIEKVEVCPNCIHAEIDHMKNYNGERPKNHMAVQLYLDNEYKYAPFVRITLNDKFFGTISVPSIHYYNNTKEDVANVLDSVMEMVDAYNRSQGWL